MKRKYKNKEKIRKVIKIIWTIILGIALIFCLIKYLVTKNNAMIAGIIIFLILTVTMIIDLIYENKNSKK